MEELIEEIEQIITIYNLNLERQKKYYDYPFTNNTAHYYQLMMIQKSLDSWTSCLEKLKKYKKDRWGPIEPRRSKEFEKRIKLEKEGIPGFITPRTIEAMLVYTKQLESRIEQVEGELLSFQRAQQ